MEQDNSMEFPVRILREKSDVVINKRKYFVSLIPAVPAQKILFKAFGSFSSGGLSNIPDDIIAELLTYAGTYNASGAEVQFATPGIIETMGIPLTDLMELEVAMVEKNFGFFGDGTLNRIADRLAKLMTSASKAHDGLNT